VIYRSSDLQSETTWEPEHNPEAGELARKFLDAEREMLRLKKVQPALSSTLVGFLEYAGNVAVARNARGELLVQVNDSPESLVLTGKTADVLRAYIDNEPVSTHDRADMTIRRRSSKW
jgi:hypothetical protein